MELKECTGCSLFFERKHFNKRKGTKDGLQYRCKKCQAVDHKRAYDKGKSSYIRKNQSRKEVIRSFVRTYKQEKGCMDCDERRWQCLSFDHLDNKTCNLSDIHNRFLSLDRVKEEIAKCEVVCHNCHAIRTHNRFGE